METVKINRLEIENVKRVKAVALKPTPEGLTIIGGKNGEGKTSVLDSIAWALGGNKFKPSEPRREGSVLPPNLKVELSNGLTVERRGKNSDLKVMDPTGERSGQALLDSFISELALDLPKFLNANDKDKANILLQIIGVKDELLKLEQEEQSLYARRLEIGRIADQKKKYAEEMEAYPEAPEEAVSAAELIKRQQAILAKNGENERLRQNRDALKDKQDGLEETIRRLEQDLKEARETYKAQAKQLETANKTVAELKDESTKEIEESISNIEQINFMVQANMAKENAMEEANHYGREYEDLSKKIDDVRKAKYDLLDEAKLPLPGLSVKDGALIYQGYQWDNMSGSDQLKVATAIVRRLNPKCGFVLMDKLEQMDQESLAEFGRWLEGQGLQVIATRVSTGEECSIIIEDGFVKETATVKPWKAGEF